MTTSEAPPRHFTSGRLSGIQTALRYTGIPTSWLAKRPKLPSRNWLIFTFLATSSFGYYFYDRRECKRIRRHYVDLVKDRADELVNPLQRARKVTVYGSKWPGDEDHDQAIKYFRKYVKPILVAAAVDYELVPGKYHGAVAEHVANEVRLRRRRDLGLDPIPDSIRTLPTYQPPEQLYEHELEGGVVIVGRPTLKEYMAGLKKGWTEPLEKIDHDEALAQEFQNDGHFDEIDEPQSEESTKHEFSKFSPIVSPSQVSSPSNRSTVHNDSSFNVAHGPPVTIPPVPPLLLLPFTNHIGFSQIPVMIWNWLNQRHHVRSGGEAGYRLVMKNTRPIIPPGIKHDDDTQGDLDFDVEAESWFKSSLSKIPSEIEKERKRFYEELPAKLVTARALARGTREPTKDELSNPPPSEVELSAERMKKEKRWRRDAAGWELVKPEQKVEWDDRFRDALQIFVDPPFNI